MDLSVFFDAQGICNRRENTSLRRFDDTFKDAYLDYRTQRWDILKKDKETYDFIKNDLWSYVDEQESETLYLAIVDNYGTFIGYATIGMLDSDYPELGLELESEHRRQGHGKDTVDMLIEVGERVLGKKKFIVRIDSDNQASLALVERYNLEEIGQEDSEYIQALDFLNEGKGEDEKTLPPKAVYDRERGRYIRRFLISV